ncbi:hypothetical protein [Streptomyces sp. SID11385]|uniref:hypothetical protein n=1 Tax=Streptomyces sp. SID11385 TaxID=2706031 RepID=UPI001EF2170C|nr:hypothetical protein [Streptomyces sp. SID11385]
MTPVLTTALAVLGTLLGATVTGVFQHLAAGRTERSAARAVETGPSGRRGGPRRG